MKTDTYTKVILTVIAACLTVIVVKDLNIIPEAHANQPLKNTTGVMVPVNDDGSINVRLNPAEVIDVNIEKINDYSIFGGAMPVKTED